MTGRKGAIGATTKPAPAPAPAQAKEEEKVDGDVSAQPPAWSAEAEAGAMGPPTPWPSGHVPRTRGEVRLWLSFAVLRADPAGPLDVKLVATRIGMSRTSIAYDGCAHGVLRAEVLREIARRAAAAAEEAGGGAPAQPAEPSRGVRYWQAIAQRADSRICEYKALAVRERQASSRTRALLRRVLDDMRAGRWTRADEDAVMIADIAAELHVADRKADAEG
ncbi:hypothetical protein [Sphingomonas sp. TX0522]|jgi:hypothetical protein|uniref:hypothetical protein n=1 Tax=Sphingomonas sp. TX0522 TaxID=2479205 RepID=UPI0018DFD27C|nr:hypothetical protein [Sphingomonas sp. TX0522]MBI0532026.1 hypothetical protein [Sphingomonas sp. TX0522]